MGELNVEQAAQLAGVSTKTIRRAIADGRIVAEKLTGRHGGYRMTRENVLALYGDSSRAERPISPIEGLTSKIEQLIEANADQSRKIEQLEAEIRDSRAQVHQLHQQVILALPPPRRSFWALFRRKSQI